MWCAARACITGCRIAAATVCHSSGICARHGTVRGAARGTVRARRGAPYRPAPSGAWWRKGYVTYPTRVKQLAGARPLLPGRPSGGCVAHEVGGHPLRGQVRAQFGQVQWHSPGAARGPYWPPKWRLVAQELRGIDPLHVVVGRRPGDWHPSLRRERASRDELDADVRVFSVS